MKLFHEVIHVHNERAVGAGFSSTTNAAIGAIGTAQALSPRDGTGHITYWEASSTFNQLCEPDLHVSSGIGVPTGTKRNRRRASGPQICR